MLNKEALLLAGGSTDLTVILRRGTGSEEERGASLAFWNGKQNFELQLQGLQNSATYNIPYVGKYVHVTPISPGYATAWDTEPEMSLIDEGYGEYDYSNTKPEMTFIFTANT